MESKECEGCGRLIDKSLLTCPYCGFTYWVDIIAVSVVALICLLIGGTALLYIEEAVERWVLFILFAGTGLLILYLPIASIADALKTPKKYKKGKITARGIRQLIIALLVSVILYVLPGFIFVEAGSEPYIEVAESYFQELSKPTPENMEIWGMSEFKVFGRGGVIMSGGPINPPSVKMIWDNPPIYEVTIPFWLEGTTIDGKHLKTKRKIHLVVIRTQTTDGWQVDSFEFGQGVPLTMREQTGNWLLRVHYSV
ncbi:MAG: hypothetical protein L0287_09820 [Anaerolineae bacterium]|nr:hypothetical protein [Anaerolineae bacterium]